MSDSSNLSPEQQTILAILSKVPRKSRTIEEIRELYLKRVIQDAVAGLYRRKRLTKDQDGKYTAVTGTLRISKSK